MQDRKRILVVRLSALGDVAILKPVLKEWAEKNYNCEFYLAAPGLLAPLFSDISNVKFIPTAKASPSELYSLLSTYRPEIVLDMHHVNRTIGMSWLFRFHGIKVYSIKKHTLSTIPSWRRYDEVLSRSKLLRRVSLDNLSTSYYSIPNNYRDVKMIGIAPFAQHKGKVWPKDQMIALLKLLDADGSYQVLMFGSKNEADELKNWTEGMENVEVLAGRYSFAEEMERIASLDLMVSMDSSNMHFASCVGVPVVSIWGATHPKSGFYGWRQNPDWAVQVDMKCRPCSKYGKKKCRFGDYRCQTSITPKMVYDKIKEVLS